MPQFAPRKSALLAAPKTAKSCGKTPIIDRAAVSKVMVAATGRPVAFAASSAVAISSVLDMVSIHSISTPPSARAFACAAKTSRVAAWVSAPIGSNSSPVGPIEPATSNGRRCLSVAVAAALRARRAAASLSSGARSCASCSFNRRALPPKELVNTKSEPASKNEAWRPWISSGRSTFHNSGG